MNKKRLFFGYNTVSIAEILRLSISIIRAIKRGRSIGNGYEIWRST